MRVVGAALLAAAAAAERMRTPLVVDHPTLGQHVVPTRKEQFVFEHVRHEKVPHRVFGNVTKSTFRSPKITLKKGEAWFSLPDVTVMPFPDNGGKPYAILGGQFDILDESGASVPLSEMYSHHWLVYDKLVGGTGYNLGCGGEDTWVSCVFGAGGEMRGIDYQYKEGYGFHTTGSEHWSANIHFIRTEDLSTEHFNGSYGEAVKSCIECGYVPGKAVTCVPGLTGESIFACCFDGSRCPVNHPEDKSTKTYYLTYNVTWTPDVVNAKPEKIFVVDALDCAVVQNLEPNMRKGPTVCDDTYCVSTVTRQMTVDAEMNWAYTHQHIGAVNATFSLNGKPICTSRPKYGTDPANTPGNEKGYAVGFTMCVDPVTGVDKTGDYVRVREGDNLTVASVYRVDAGDDRALPIPGGGHRGVMGLYFFLVHEDVQAKTYKCSAGQCVVAEGGVDIVTCHEACG
eukprot:TRINITY_DN61_c0_g1_i2.p2 TRINITY_DN61_c0_g1~~TRINITY_DN61_c0_g1_i2.p2  ORF type:complete len:455 (+),score=161.30 TRINITY_DN61_c0_g1_i2:69-1433(+)